MNLLLAHELLVSMIADIFANLLNWMWQPYLSNESVSTQAGTIATV